MTARQGARKGAFNLSKDSPKPFIRTFFLADKAEVVNGKLYVMGGYVERLWSQGFPVMANLSAVMVIGIPSILANQSIKFKIDISAPLTGSLAKAEGTTQVASDPTPLDPSQPLRSIIVIPITVPVQSASTVNLVATVEGAEDSAKIELRVAKAGQ